MLVDIVYELHSDRLVVEVSDSGEGFQAPTNRVVSTRRRRAGRRRPRDRDHRGALRRARDRRGRRRRLASPVREAPRVAEVAGRRSLIIVSNRGPVTFDRGGGRRARHAPRRRRARDGAARAARASRRDLDRGGDDRRGPRRRSGGIERRLRSSRRTPDAYHGYYNVVANPMLWFIQHGLWGRGLRPDLDQAFHAAWRDYETVNRAFAERVVVELDNKPGAAVLFQDYHLYLAPAYVRAARPDAELAHFVHIPWPVDWTILPESDAPRRARRLARQRRRRVSHRALGAELRGELRRDRRRSRPHARHAPRHLDRHRRVRRTGAVGRRARGGARPRGAPPGEARVARRPHRPVEEHRARPRSVRPPARHAPRVAGPRADARAARSVTPGDPRVRRVRGRDRAHGRGDQRASSGCDRPPGRRQLPAVGRGVQAVRRAARERGVRRPEPRRQGGAARQHARRCARPLRERRRARGARRSGR